MLVEEGTSYRQMIKPLWIALKVDRCIIACHHCANSAHENYPVRNINTGQAGQINCRLLKYFDKSNFDWRFNLAALELIPAHTELLANYEPFVARDNE